MNDAHGALWEAIETKEAEIQILQHTVQELRARIEELEVWSHEPYDFTDLTDRLDNLERHVHGSDPMEE